MSKDRAAQPATPLAGIVGDLVDAGVPGVLLRVADRTGTVTEHLAGHRQTYHMLDGPGWLPEEVSAPPHDDADIRVLAARDHAGAPVPGARDGAHARVPGARGDRAPDRGERGQASAAAGPGREPAAGVPGAELAPRRPVVPLDSPPALGADAVFDLASVSKLAGTTAALMSLVEAGSVDLDGPARDWIAAVPAGIRVRDLLRHRAGLAEWWPVYAAAAGPGDPACGAAAGTAEGGPAGDAPRGAPVAGAERAITAVPLRYPVDTERHYSDLGFMLLGLVVERAAGAPLADAVRRLVFEPAGMTGAHYRPGGIGPDVPLVATGHGDWYERRMLATGRPYPTGIGPDAFAGWRDHTIRGEVHDGNAWHAFGGVAGHAGLFGGADDLVAFGRALLSPDGPWRGDTLRRFTAAGPDAGQGLGFWRWPEHGAIGHGGFTGIRFGVLPDIGRIVVLATNRVHVPGTELLDLNPYWDRILTAAREQT